MDSVLIETQLRERFIDVSCRKLAAARRGGTDPLRRSLHVLGLLREIHQEKTRLEDECSALLSIPIKSHSSRRSNNSRMVVVIEQAPPQRVESPSPVEVPQQEDPDSIQEPDVPMEEDQDGSSMARKRKALGVDSNLRHDPKHRFYNNDDGNSST